MNRPPTMRDVALLAHVSQRTVSNVVNNYKHVSITTRSRVMQAIEELGYTPNISAQNLRSGRTGIIALAVPKLSWPYFGQIAHLVQVEARRHGYTLIVAETDGTRDQEISVLRHFNAHLIDGMIISPIELALADLTEPGPLVPTVLIGESIRSSDLPHFEIDGVVAGSEVAAHLLSQGARSFLIVGSTTTVMTSGPGPLRFEGFRTGLAAAGIGEESWETLVAPWTFRGAYRAMSRWLREKEAKQLTRSGGPLEDTGGEGLFTIDLPDAIITMNDIMAGGVLRALADFGFYAPLDTLVTGWDDTPESRYSIPSLSTIRPDKRAIAQRSVDTLVAMIAGEEPQTSSEPIPHELVVRESSTMVGRTAH